MSDSPADRLLAAARALGIDVFILPAPVTPGIEGTAWRDGWRLLINLYTAERTPYWAHLLAHEVAHHLLGHTSYRTSETRWTHEYAAERLALEILSRHYDEPTVWAAEQRAKAYIRPMVGRLLDYGICHHGEIDVGIWAGCEITLEEAMNDVE